jgi:multicomponent K+:H+ antiporter subunit F
VTTREPGAIDVAAEFAAGSSALEPVLRAVVLIGMFVVCGCIILGLIRILRGPTLADRVLAADALALFVVALVILLGIVLRTDAFFDAALLVAIIGFVSTLAFSRFLLTTTPLPPAPDPADDIDQQQGTGETDDDEAAKPSDDATPTEDTP